MEKLVKRESIQKNSGYIAKNSKTTSCVIFLIDSVILNKFLNYEDNQTETNENTI